MRTLLKTRCVVVKFVEILFRDIKARDVTLQVVPGDEKGLKCKVNGLYCEHDWLSYPVGIPRLSVCPLPLDVA